MHVSSTSKLRRAIAVASSFLATTIALAGCAGDGAPDTASAESSSAPADTVEYTTPRTMPEGKGSGEDDGVFPRTVVHFQGETVIEQEPERVVVISTGQADAMLTLGIVPVGSTAGDGAEMIPQYLYDAFPGQEADIDSISYVGSRFDPDLEAIANLAPDLIVLNLAGKDDIEAFSQSLGAIAPTVVTQGTGLYWKQDFLLLADAVGKTEEARSWLDDFHTEAAEFGSGVEGNPTVSFLRKNGDRTRVFGVASFSGSVAEDAGLSRPESQSFTDETSVDISAEELALADGDWIYYGVQGSDDSELTSLALWPTLTAVDDGQAVSVDDDVFYLNVGPTAARGILTELQSTLG